MDLTHEISFQPPTGQCDTFLPKRPLVEIWPAGSITLNWPFMNPPSIGGFGAGGNVAQLTEQRDSPYCSLLLPTAPYCALLLSVPNFHLTQLSAEAFATRHRKITKSFSFDLHSQFVFVVTISANHAWAGLLRSDHVFVSGSLWRQSDQRYVSSTNPTFCLLVSRRLMRQIALRHPDFCLLRAHSRPPTTQAELIFNRNLNRIARKCCFTTRKWKRCFESNLNLGVS